VSRALHWMWQLLLANDLLFSCFISFIRPSTLCMLIKRAMLITVLGFGLPAFAVDFYDAEIIIFRQLDSLGDAEELNIPRERHVNLHLELESLLQSAITISLEPAIEGYLASLSQRLRVSRNYEIIFHGRWSQTTSDRKKSPHVLINLPAIKDQTHSMAGILHLFSTDLLYIDTLLRYRPEKELFVQNKDSSEENAIRPYYFIKERRRIKFQEVHFFDHPKFGAILTVWPIKLPELLELTEKSHPNRQAETP